MYVRPCDGLLYLFMCVNCHETCNGLLVVHMFGNCVDGRPSNPSCL